MNIARFTGLASLCLVAILGGPGCMMHRGVDTMHEAYTLDKEGLSYANHVLPGIVGHWDAAYLMKEASPQLLDHASRDKIEGYFKLLNTRLGPLKHLRPAEGKADITTVNHREFRIGVYQAEGEFTKGDAVLKLRLIKQDGRWEVLFFGITSDELPLS